jgi:chitodextrinase
MSIFFTTGNTSHTTTLEPLADSTTYTYYVKCQDTATNISGNALVTFSVATPADTTQPSQPTGLTATAISSSQINLSWTASTDNVGVTGYQVFRGGVQVAATSGISYSDTGLTASTQYTYTVRAVDAAGKISNASASQSATTQMVVSGGGPVPPSGPDAYSTVWKPLKIGAGGFISGIDIGLDGTKIIRTDTYGAYWWNGTQWVQLVNATSMPTSEVNLEKNEGVYEIRIAPSNTSRFYMTYMGNVYRTDNKGISWTKTAFSTVTGSDSNDNYRTNGQKIAVDPVNPDVVYVGTTNNGLWVTTNAGSSWSQVSHQGRQEGRQTSYM